MHREVSHTDDPFRSESPLGLYLLTAIVGGLLAADLWPLLAGWLGTQGIETYSWPREFYGYRFSLIAAVLGGARVLYGSLEASSRAASGPTWPSPSPARRHPHQANRSSRPRSSSSAWSASAWSASRFERTQRAIRKLVELFPRRCWLLRDGQEVRALTAELQVGDRSWSSRAAASRSTASSSTAAPPWTPAP